MGGKSPGIGECCPRSLGLIVVGPLDPCFPNINKHGNGLSVFLKRRFGFSKSQVGPRLCTFYCLLLLLGQCPH